MAKTVVKEIFIMILLLIAIVLILGVLFYDYIPLNKTIPNKISYTIPEEVENELKKAQVQDTAPTNVLYQVEASELKMYEKTKNYKPGKINPFGTVSSATQGNTTGNTSSNSTSGRNY